MSRPSTAGDMPSCWRKLPTRPNPWQKVMRAWRNLWQGAKSREATVAMNRSSWQRRRATAGYAVLLFLLMVSFAAMLQGQEDASPGKDHLAIAARYRQEAAETQEAIKRHQLSRQEGQRLRVK